MKKPTTYEIAFSAVAASFSLLFVWLSTVVSFLSITFNCIAAVMLMLPLTVSSPRASFLSYLAVSGLSFAVTAFPNQMPFVLFFGFYSFFGYLINSKVKPFWLGYLIKLAYFNIVLYVILKFIGLNLSETVNDFVSNRYYIVAIAVSAVFLLYDYAYYSVLKLMTKLVKTRLKIKLPDKEKHGSADNGIFSEDISNYEKNESQVKKTAEENNPNSKTDSENDRKKEGGSDSAEKEVLSDFSEKSDLFSNGKGNKKDKDKNKKIEKN